MITILEGKVNKRFILDQSGGRRQRLRSYDTRSYPEEDQPLRTRAVYTVATRLGSCPF